jgi:hypothetical protein
VGHEVGSDEGNAFGRSKNDETKGNYKYVFLGKLRGRIDGILFGERRWR